MKYTQSIIKLLKDRYSDIEYYYLHLDKIQRNADENPDIAIETCKSLIEGISKFIIKNLDSVNYNDKLIDDLAFPQLVKKALSAIADYNEDIEDDFVNKVNKLIVSIGEIRNKRGDISHGKLSPKSYCSDSFFANLVVQITDSILFYVLTCFSKVELLKELSYADNQDFNVWLDSVKQFGFLSYSKALFDQDLDAYKQELLTYLDSKESKNG